MKGLPKKVWFRPVGKRALVGSLLCAGTAFLVMLGTPLATADEFARSLVFADRVAYQYAIEEVYWQHRIWPKDNTGPKPPLDAVLSREQVEAKVADYLQKSRLVSDSRGLPITTSELQKEMDRMASYTKQPEVLRNLFAALGNNPFVIAECLARPILAERLVNEPANSRDGSSSRWFSSARRALTPYGTAAMSQPYTLPEIIDDCIDNTWTPTTIVNAPDGRSTHSAVWTGTEMIVWGGFIDGSGWVNSGGKYNPSMDSWTATSTVNAPVPRSYHTAVWTGTEMIVWGGEPNPCFNTGGRYNPMTDTWIPTSTANAPVARAQHTAVWTGREMIIWGGRDGTGWFNLGGRYDPTTDSWTTTSTVNAPSARWDHSAMWTGSEMIIWAGTNQTIYLHTGGRYNPRTDTWTATSTVNVPLGRVGHTTVWTGNEMIVWGGEDETFVLTNSGGRYDPINDSWAVTNLATAPSPRSGHSGVWTGNEMVIWGGYFNPSELNTGGRYHPTTDNWTPTSTGNAPLARDTHTAVWTGNKMIVWGGINVDSPEIDLNTGGIYCAQPSSPMMQSAISRKTHAFGGTFDVDLPLTGTPGIECRSGGATNDYTLVVTFLANVSVEGSPQAAVTSGVGTIGSNGVANSGRVLVADNLVTIPLTNVANAQTIQVTLYGVNGSTNFIISMSILIGDTNGNGTVNAADVSQTKSRVGQQINATNFRSDVNANGYIDAADIAIVKSHLGTGLP